jgi:hypothetical protein
VKESIQARHEPKNQKGQKYEPFRQKLEKKAPKNTNFESRRMSKGFEKLLQQSYLKI